MTPVTLDLLAGIGAFDLIERTSSTLRVQQVVQLSLAPAFLLSFNMNLKKSGSL